VTPEAGSIPGSAGYRVECFMVNWTLSLTDPPICNSADGKHHVGSCRSPPMILKSRLVILRVIIVGHGRFRSHFGSSSDEMGFLEVGMRV
jgi:hypothetical protein